MVQNTTAPSNNPEQGAVTRGRTQVRRGVEWLANRNMFAVAGAFFATGLLLDRSGFETVDLLFYVVGGVAPLLLATVATSEDGYDHEPSRRMRAKLLLSQIGWSVTPWGILTQVLQIGGTALAYVRNVGRLPNRDRNRPETTFTVPFDGEWTVTNGGVTKATSHSWGLVSQRYAYDFVVTEDGSTSEADGDDPSDYHAFGKPVRAPADGTVVTAKDGLRDHPHPGTGWIEWRTWNIPGNHVVIKHADGEYSTLAHLRKDSVAVEPGEQVERGEVVGECGNSGTSTEPHLHFQIQDHANFWLAAGLVPTFTDVAVDRQDDRRADHDVYRSQNGAVEDAYFWAGDRVGAGNRQS